MEKKTISPSGKIEEEKNFVLRLKLVRIELNKREWGERK